MFMVFVKTVLIYYYQFHNVAGYIQPIKLLLLLHNILIHM